MNIVYFGWGSLIWAPRSLKTIGRWKNDGPLLPIEFARISQDRRLTLVLYPQALNNPVLWIQASQHTLQGAIENLRQRESTQKRRIGYVSVYDDTPHCEVVPEMLKTIQTWIYKKEIDCAVWTDLPSNFSEKTGMTFCAENVVTYLKNLSKERQEQAKTYIQKAPSQIKTPIRTFICQQLEW